MRFDGDKKEIENIIEILKNSNVLSFPQSSKFYLNEELKKCAEEIKKRYSENEWQGQKQYSSILFIGQMPTFFDAFISLINN